MHRALEQFRPLERTAIPWLVVTRADDLSARRAIADAAAVVRREDGDRLDQLTDQWNRTEEPSHECAPS